MMGQRAYTHTQSLSYRTLRLSYISADPVLILFYALVVIKYWPVFADTSLCLRRSPHQAESILTSTHLNSSDEPSANTSKNKVKLFFSFSGQVFLFIFFHICLKFILSAFMSKIYCRYSVLTEMEYKSQNL